MGKLLIGVVTAIFALAVGLAILSPPRQPTVAELAADYARADKIRQQAELEARWAPIRAAAFNLGLIGGMFGLLCYLGALGVTHITRFRRYARPDHAGLLPVALEDQDTARDALLSGYHLARVEDARRAMVAQVPDHLVYSPHISYRLDGATGSSATLGTPEPAALPGLIDLAALGFTPSPQAVLLGLGPGGDRITVAARDLCHVALVGATGGGKSNLMRLLLPQLQACGARVVLADPHHAPVDPESGDDWTPIVQRLHMAPAVTPDEIGTLLAFLGEELRRRLELRRAGKRWGPSLFLALDELPIIADSVPGAMKGLGQLLREGRKVGLYTVGASQSMLVKVIGGDSSAREAYRTAFYVGGDLPSAAALLDMPQRAIVEGDLTTGMAYLRSKATAPAQIVRVPLASNGAIRGLLEGAQPSEGTPHGRHMDATPDLASTASVRPEAARALALFREGADIGQIVHELRGIAPGRGGRAYQQAAGEIQSLIREAMQL